MEVRTIPYSLHVSEWFLAWSENSECGFGWTFDRTSPSNVEQVGNHGFSHDPGKYGILAESVYVTKTGHAHTVFSAAGNLTPRSVAGEQAFSDHQNLGPSLGLHAHVTAPQQWARVRHGCDRAGARQG